jgi:hypothetical protein
MTTPTTNVEKYTFSNIPPEFSLSIPGEPFTYQIILEDLYKFIQQLKNDQNLNKFFSTLNNANATAQEINDLYNNLFTDVKNYVFKKIEFPNQPPNTIYGKQLTITDSTGKVYFDNDYMAPASAIIVVKTNGKFNIELKNIMFSGTNYLKNDYFKNNHILTSNGVSNIKIIPGRRLSASDKEPTELDPKNWIFNVIGNKLNRQEMIEAVIQNIGSASRFSNNQISYYVSYKYNFVDNNQKEETIYIRLGYIRHDLPSTM